MERKNNEKIGFLKFWTWNIRSVSTGIQTVLISYITFYCTDVLGLKAALIATILMLTKLFDGVTDLFAGYIVDKTHTKLGKARPYEISIVGLWLATWAIFSVPTNVSTVVQYIWIAVAYTFAQSIFTTLLTANNTAYMVRAFNSQPKYVKLSSFGGLITVAGVAVFNVFFPTMMENASTNAAAWSKMVLTLAIPLVVIGLLRFICVPEVYDVDGGTDKVDFKEVVSLLKNNKNIYPLAFAAIISAACTSFGASTYYFKYIVKDVSLMGIISIFTVVAMLTMIFYPMILKKISVKQLAMLGCFTYAVGGVILFFANDNMLLLGLGNIVLGAGSLPTSMMGGLLIVECADYNEWCGRPRMEGTLGSVTGFANKVGSALGTLICGVLLSAAGYSGTAEVLPNSAMMMIKCLYSLIPGVLYFIVMLIYKTYKLDEKIDEIRSDNEARRNAQIDN